MEKYRKMVAENIRRLRRERGLSQFDLAAILGVSRPLISLYENGKRCPSMAQLLALSNCFKVSLDQMTGRLLPTAAEGGVEQVKNAAAPFPHAVGEEIENEATLRIAEI